MKALDLFWEGFVERRVRKFGRGCARAMLMSFTSQKAYYEGFAPTYAWVARKALNTRPNWSQVDQITFVYKCDPTNRIAPDTTTDKDKRWMTGTLEIDDSMSLLDVIKEVVRIELYCDFLDHLEVWKRLELIDLAVYEAVKYIRR
jgi:hypothetical protein